MLHYKLLNRHKTVFYFYNVCYLFGTGTFVIQKVTLIEHSAEYCETFLVCYKNVLNLLQTLPLGSTASLPCQATSQETMITWLKDGVPLDSPEERIYLDEENTLTIKG